MPPLPTPRFDSRAVNLVYALVLLLALGACAPQDGLPQDGLPLSPVQSPNDEKGYRYVQLDNGLRVLLISDPDTEKAAASLDVYVGSASNPADRGGLAHFLEHMLFLGTDKYPDSGEYATFVSEHGGTRNAYTAFEHTNYFFDIDQAHLEEALDRFAQFFISPRFDVEYVEREVNAVNAEYQMGLTTDARRGLDVMADFQSTVAVRGACRVYPRSGSLRGRRDRRGEPARRAGRGRGDPMLPQRLPSPWYTLVRRPVGQFHEVHRVPVPRMGVRAQRRTGGGAEHGRSRRL